MNKKIINIKSGENPSLSKIQEAINSLGKDGGVIQLGKGKHVTAPLTLTSHIELNVDEGAELCFSDDFSLYKPVHTRWEGTECHALQSMIFAEDSSNISISGQGTINGSGQKWWSSYREMRKGIISSEVALVQSALGKLNISVKGGSGGGGIETNFLRPSLIQFKNCRDCSIEGVSLRDSAFWNTHILYSRNIRIDNVTFINPPDAPNTDGLDIDSSRFVTVENCRFNVGDDCLCLKSGMDEDGRRVGLATENITVKNCHMNNGHGAIVLGSETSGGIRNVIISHCVFNGTDRGIRIKTRRGRGGTIENISLKQIEMTDVLAPVVINMYYRCGADPSLVETLKSLDKGIFNIENTPVIRNISIEDVHAVNVKSSAAFLLGLPESPLANIQFKNFHIETFSKGDPEEPAMDLFYTKPSGPEIIYRFLSDPSFENIQIDNYFGDTLREIGNKELKC